MSENILSKIQVELKAPKNQENKFGHYKYRSCEDILEAVKPLLKKYDCSLVIADEIVLIGTRYYVKATAILRGSETNETTTAYARETETRKGMDDSQVTGATSSYARKYALNGLFAIDDTEDADAESKPKKDKKGTLLPELKKESPEFIKAKQYIHEGGLMDNIRIKYNVSEEVEQLLNAK